MSEDGTNKARVKKVSAYPISLQLKTASGAMAGKIVKLTMNGFLAEMPPSQHQPGDRFDCTFELPVTKHWINEPCRLVKLYAHWKQDGPQGEPTKAAPPAAPTSSASAAPAGAPVNHLMELHFQGLNEKNKRAVHEFLSMLQKHTL